MISLLIFSIIITKKWDSLSLLFYSRSYHGADVNLKNENFWAEIDKFGYYNMIIFIVGKFFSKFSLPFFILMVDLEEVFMSKRSFTHIIVNVLRLDFVEKSVHVGHQQTYQFWPLRDYNENYAQCTCNVKYGEIYVNKFKSGCVLFSDAPMTSSLYVYQDQVV